MKNYNSITVIDMDSDKTTVNDLVEIKDLDETIVGIGEDMYVVFKKDHLTSWMFHQKTATDQDEQKENIQLIVILRLMVRQQLVVSYNKIMDGSIKTIIFSVSKYYE